uniref:Uncharacterized protein n=1 Tax=Steinernema glaseri TaxID=37863 RepID=A0A1I7Y317_9BILA
MSHPPIPPSYQRIPIRIPIFQQIFFKSPLDVLQLTQQHTKRRPQPSVRLLLMDDTNGDAERMRRRTHPCALQRRISIGMKQRFEASLCAAERLMKRRRTPTLYLSLMNKSSSEI